MNSTFARWLTIGLAAAAVGCWNPQSSRPGFGLRGEAATTAPADWNFVNEHREIAIEVRTPYLLPHSVTIWCVAVDGKLYIAARAPDTKRWPGWADRDPNVRLLIDERIYTARVSPLDDPSRIAPVRRAYASKYELPESPPEGSPPLRYWAVESRLPRGLTG